MKAPPALIADLGDFADRSAAALKKLGYGTIVWSALYALSLGLLVAALKNSTWIRGFLRPAATLATVWPTVAIMLGAVPVLGACIGILAWQRNRRRPGTAIEWLGSWIRRLRWIVALPLVLALSAPIENNRPFLTIGLCLLVGIVATYSAYFWSEGFAAPESHPRWKAVSWWILGACAIAYFAAILRLALINHWSFKTNRADLGFYMSVFRNSSLGYPLRCTLCVGGTHASGHFDPILVLLSPLYLLYPYSETLLVLQTAWLASSVVPLHLLARRAIGDPRVALAVTLSFLAYPALHGVSLFDFHSLALIIPLLLWFAYFFVTERWKSYGVTLVALLLCREDVSLVVFLAGIAILFSGKPRSGRVAFLTILSSLLYFVVVKKVFMASADPLNSGEGADSHAYYFAGLIPPGTATLGLLGTLLTDPFLVLGKVFDEGKAEYVLALLSPLMFLPLLGRGRICLVYGAFLTLVATRPIASINFHYSSLLIPVLFALTVDALGRLARGAFVEPNFGRRLCGSLAVGILTTTLLMSWKFGAFWPNTAFRAGLRIQLRALNPALVERARWLHAVARRLPRDTSIAANTLVLPHLGRIRDVYMIGNRTPPAYLIYSTDFDPRIRRFVERSIKSGRLVKVENNSQLTLYRNMDMKSPWMD